MRRGTFLIALVVLSLGCSRTASGVVDEGFAVSTQERAVTTEVVPTGAARLVPTDDGGEPGCQVPGGWWSTATLGDTFWDHAVFGLGQDSILAMGPGDQITEISLEDPAKTRQVSNSRYSTFALSPAGDYLAGIIAGSEQFQGELALLNLATGEEELTNVSAYGVLAWIDSGESLIFVAQDGEEWWLRKLDLGSRTTMDLVLAPSSGGEWPYGDPVIEISTRIIGERSHPTGSLSPDGQQLLFTVGSHVARVFRLDLDTGSLYTYPHTETDGHFAHWMPDGRYAYFGHPGIIVLDTATGEVETHRPFPLVHWVTDVAADGRILARFENCWGVGMLSPAR